MDYLRNLNKSFFKVSIFKLIIELKIKFKKQPRIKSDLYKSFRDKNFFQNFAFEDIPTASHVLMLNCKLLCAKWSLDTIMRYVKGELSDKCSELLAISRAAKRKKICVFQGWRGPHVYRESSGDFCQAAFIGCTGLVSMRAP